MAVDLLNGERRQRNLPVFTPDARLNEAAQHHAEDMATRHYYSHTSPEGDTVMDRFVRAGGTRWRLVEENIAHCPGCRPPPTRDNVERLHEGWMESRHHRENILNPGVDRFGFGVAVVPDGGLYAVQTFAGPGASRGSEVGSAGSALAPPAQQARAVEIVNSFRTEQGAPSLAASDALAAVARSLLPEKPEEELSLDRGGDLLGVLPPDERSRWRQVAVIAGTCGGCGTQPTAGDIRFFREQWAGNPDYRRRLTDAGVTHLGFAMAADGQGRKLAVAVLGTQR